MSQAPDSYAEYPVQTRFRFARVNLVKGETTYDERYFLSRRDFLENLANWNHLGLAAAPRWAYYEAPGP